MADNITAPATGAIFATDQIGTTHYPRTKVGFGVDGVYADVSADTPLPVAIVSGGGSGGGGGDASAANQATEIARLTSILSSVDGLEALLTTINTLLGGTLTIALPTGAATNAGIASALAAQTYYPATQPVSGSVGVSGTVAVTGSFYQATQPVSIANSVAVTGPLTDTQLRASAVPVAVGGSVAVTGTFFQATQPISASALPLPSGAATSAKQDAIVTALGSPLQAGGNVAVTASALPTGAATAAKQDTAITALQNSAPADDLFAITPSDTVALATIPKALLVTAAGNVAVRGTGASPVTLAVTAGQILPIRARYVYATNTTATVVGLV